jgi:hypothetical protein
VAQTLGLGTQFMNLVGFHAWVGTEKEVVAVQVTEWDEPQAVIGSYLHRYAYPDWAAEHRARDLVCRWRSPMARARALPATARRASLSPRASAGWSSTTRPASATRA